MGIGDFINEIERLVQEAEETAKASASNANRPQNTRQPMNTNRPPIRPIQRPSGAGPNRPVQRPASGANRPVMSRNGANRPVPNRNVPHNRPQDIVKKEHLPISKEMPAEGISVEGTSTEGKPVTPVQAEATQTSTPVNTQRGNILNLAYMDGNDILKGIVLSEVLGKPKALRRGRW